jgi:hypothetical protein
MVAGLHGHRSAYPSCQIIGQSLSAIHAALSLGANLQDAGSSYIYLFRAG